MRARLPHCALALLTLAGVAALPAADYYVSEKGDDANPGTTVAQPFRTLQRADSAVAPGDTVWVMAGTYRNDLKRPGGTTSLLTLTTSGRPDAWITWRNYRNDRPELIAQGCWNAIHLRASYLVIDGLTLTGNNDNVRQIDAEANAEIDVAKTMAAFAASTAAKTTATIDESVAPDAKLSSREAAKAVPAPRPKPVQAHHADPRFNGNGINVDCRSGPKFHHFVIRNCTVRKFGTVGIGMIHTDYYTIENCVIYENAWYGRYGGSGISQLLGHNFDDSPGYHNVIRGNRVWNNKCLVRCFNTDCFSDGNGIILDSLGDYSGGVLVENNLCFNNGGSGIHVFKSNRARIDVVHNTLWRNQQMWSLYDLGAHSAVNVRFLNNIVCAERRKQVNSRPAAGIVFDDNLYYGSDQIPTKGKRDLIADPKFILPSTDPGRADFRLQAGSPAIDSAGLELTPKSDLAGTTRPSGAAPDRGAFEYQPSVPPGGRG
jgi:hypothetical protein